ncbi:hypothetical protein O181_074833 [Austropuccinia psidii MF-1]|uniref:Integrase catalytic domain-containing protein n=1 Tax=Austropuccinia psidii MF-1 TaxID=1389203 RepID=A0A9Q3IBB2_9BASI|nr:hypothetical protein [Austropuccinia psidii MF-1]
MLITLSSYHPPNSHFKPYNNHFPMQPDRSALHTYTDLDTPNSHPFTEIGPADSAVDEKLTSPIPLCVATHTTRRSFVTGMGSLVYPGYRGALLNAGALLELIGNDILISTRGDGPVLCANYSASGDSAPDYLRFSSHKIHSCNECLKSRSLRHLDLHSLNCSPTPLEIVVADLMGPFDVATINGGRYALNVHDVASTYGKCQILKNKSNATSWLEETINKWHRSTSHLVKILQTDNGGEFNNATMNMWLQQQGITHERILPFFHQQNGVAEQYNRTIANMGCTILLGSKLLKSFWGHTFMWAAYTNNMLPNLHKGQKTPMEILFKLKPQLDWMRIFGEIAFIHVPQENCQKLDDCAVKGNVVMHLPNSKGWLFYIPDQDKFVSSAWATFSESSHLIKMLMRPETSTASKCAINFLLNKSTLGDFSAEHMVEEQDLASSHVVNEFLQPPKSYAEAMKWPDSMAWKQAINQEIENMKNHAVFEISPLPANTKPIGGGWVFVKKLASRTCDARYKAQYIAQGNSQLSGYNFHETFAPTATFTSLRLLLTIAVHLKWHTSSFDFMATYLNVQIDEELWIRPPKGLGCK